MPLEKLDKAQKIQLLQRLRKKLKSLVLSLEAPNAPIGAELPSGSEARLTLSHSDSCLSRPRSTSQSCCFCQVQSVWGASIKRIVTRTGECVTSSACVADVQK